MPVRKAICLGANGARHPGNDQDYRTAQPLFKETGAKWVRLWAEWSEIEKTQGVYNNTMLDGLTAQMDAARADEVRVILVSWRTPLWVPKPPVMTDDQAYVVPSDVGPNGHWAGWIRFLYDRFADRIDVLELCNEPNSQMKPQTSIHVVVRDMFQTAMDISAARGHRIFIGGPGLDDTSSSSSSVTPYQTFMTEFFKLNFRPHSKFVWTHHNYADVEGADSAFSGGTSDSAATAANMLRGQWAGYSDGSGPALLNTEGGARVAKMPSYPSSGTPTATQQAQALSEQATRNDNKWAAYMRVPLDGSRPQVAMHTQYLVYDAPELPNKYSGLCNTLPSGGAKRPVFDRFKLFKGNPQDLKRFRGWTNLGPFVKHDPAICSTRPGHLEVFATGYMDGQLYHKWSWDGAPWSDWVSLGGALIYGPAAVSRGEGKMDVFAVTNDRSMWTTWWSASGGWPGGWAPMGAAGRCYSAPAVCSMHENHLEVFVLFDDGRIHHNWWYGGGWSGWHPLPAAPSPLRSAPTAVSWANGRMDVYARGDGDTIWHTYFQNGAWSAWDSGAGGWIAGAPAVASWNANRLDIFARGTDNVLYRRCFDRMYGAWESMGKTVASSPAAVSWDPGRIDVAVIVNNEVHLSSHY
jgi:hypothetical protein